MRPVSRFLALSTLLFAASTLVVRADTVAFTYSGTDTTGRGATSTGSGDLSFNGPASSLTLADLTAFSFSQTTNIPGPGASTFTYSLGELFSFSATLNGDQLLTLALNTGLVAGSVGFFQPEAFAVTSLSAGGATTSSFSGMLESGQVIQTPTGVTPEPSTLALLGTGLAGLAGVARRKFLSNR